MRVQDIASSTYQKIGHCEFSEPLLAVDAHADVYGDLTARGTAGARPGEYAASKLPFESVALLQGEFGTDALNHVSLWLTSHEVLRCGL